jgi:voltage-gated potassium channel
VFSLFFFSSSFSPSLNFESRKEFVSKVNEGLKTGVGGARGVMEELMSQHVVKPHLLTVRQRWVMMLVSFVVFFKVSLSLGFGPFESEHVFDVSFLVLHLAAVVYFGEWDIWQLLILIPLGSFRFQMLNLEVIRLVSLVPFLQGLRFVVSGSISRLFGLFILLVVCTHGVACMWFALGAFENFESGWAPPPEFRSGTVFLTYWKSFNWSLKSLTQGPDGSPETGLEIMLSLAIMFLGFSVYATIIGSIGSVLMNLDSESNNWIEKKEGVDRYVQSSNLPDPLFRRISDYYTYLKNNRRQVGDQGEIFFELPGSLQTDISLHLTKDLLSKVSFFKNAPVACLSYVAKQLKPLSFPPGERIVTEGEVGQSMFFLMRGLLEVCSGLKVLTLLHDGAVFGEMALLIQNQPRTATIRALAFSDVFELSRQNLEDVLVLWPELREALTQTMEERIASSAAIREKLERGSTPDSRRKGSMVVPKKKLSNTKLTFQSAVRRSLREAKKEEEEAAIPNSGDLERKKKEEERLNAVEAKTLAEELKAQEKKGKEEADAEETA